jgi:signal transduction histidine kinase
VWRRPWRGGLGLRGRIVGAVLVTTVATLVVAAVALLGPLEHSLRNVAKNTLRNDLMGTRHTTGALVDFRDTLHLSYIPLTALPLQTTNGELKHDQRIGEVNRFNLVQRQELTLGNRVGATSVTLLGYPDLQTGVAEIIPPPQSPGQSTDPFDDAALAFRTGLPVYSFGTLDGTEYVRAAIPIRLGDQRFVLAVRKPIDEIPAAVHAVRTAFLYAALAGLGLTLLLAIPLAATIVRRLRRLRQAAVQMAEHGPGVDVPGKRARDEVGDLARTFAAMQERLRQQEEARRAFVATASHELRTPLASLDGMLELLDDDLHDDEPDLQDARSLLDRARAQSRRLGRLAADLLDLSRLDAQVQLRSEPVELGELSRAVLAEFELGTAERSLITELDDSRGSVWALGDPGSVARILRILLDNAVRASPEGGEVRVELRNGSTASLSVCDQGPGIPEEERELIFERFQRGRDTAGQAGFGLGLAIGRELAERMGGELVLEHGEHPGATFTLRLPATQAPQEEPIAIG